MICAVIVGKLVYAPILMSVILHISEVFSTKQYGNLYVLAEPIHCCATYNDTDVNDLK